MPCAGASTAGTGVTWMRGSSRPTRTIEFYSEIARRMEGAETVSRGVAGLRRFWDDWHAVWNR